ncbi:unnamed protein product [Linum grandiflorum]
MKTFSSIISATVGITIVFSLVSVAKSQINRNGSLVVNNLDISGTWECLATYHYYRPKNMGWNMRDPTVNTYCSTWDSQKSLAWRSRYGWTAFCRSDGVPIGQYFCGMCIKVKNERTGAHTIARIVDECTKPEGGLDLDDQTVFNKIDTDGNGYHLGHMKVSYEFVNC